MILIVVDHLVAEELYCTARVSLSRSFTVQEKKRLSVMVRHRKSVVYVMSISLVSVQTDIPTLLFSLCQIS